MLNTASLELTNSIDYDLTWKTVKKGFRSSSRKPARRLGLAKQQNDKSTKKETSSASESEKLGVDVLGRHFTGKIDHVPIKKRKLMLSSTSTPPRNPSPHGLTLSSQSRSSPPSKGSSSGQCVGSKSVSGFNGPAAVQFSLGTEDGDWNGKQTWVPISKPVDFSGITLLADAALQSIPDDTLDAKGSLTMGDPSTPVATDPSLSALPLKRTSTSDGTTPLVHEVLAHDDSIDVSEVHVNRLAAAEKRCRDTEKMPASRKDVRLHWDLNTVMESWDLEDDVGPEGLPPADEHRANTDNLEGHVVQCEPCVELSKHSTDAEGSTEVISRNEVPTGVHLETQSSLLLDLVVSQKITLETINIQSKDDLIQRFDAPEKGTSPTNSVTPVTHKMFDECPSNKLGKTGLSQASPEHDNLSASGTTFEEGQPAVAGGIVDNGKEPPAPDTAQKDYFLHVKREEMPKTYNFLGEALVENCDYGGYDSDVSQGGHDHIVAVGNGANIQTGYESPFEDGELREPDIFTREENEVEGEAECVDYDLHHDRDAEEFDASNHCLSEVASESCQIDKGSSTEKIMYSAIPLNESSYLSKEFSGDQSPGVHERYINRSGGVGNVASQENNFPDQVDRLIVKASSGEVGPKENRGRMFRQPEETLYSGGTHRQNNTNFQRSRYRYDTFHSGKVFGSGKPLRRHQDENEGGHHWAVSCGNLRKTHPTGCDDPLDDEDRRQRSGIANSAENDDRLTPRYQRRFVHHPTSNFHQPFRRRSPSDRDDYSVRRRVVASRDGTHFRRGRPGIYRHGVSRVPKDEYYGPMCDNSPPSSSVQQPHYSARRERSFSPVLSRENSLSHPRRRSRSKSRSPPVWHLQRDRAMGTSPPGRSMDYRSDSRMERVRIPFRKSNFAADDVFMASPPRRRFSPSCQPRWIDNRKCSAPDLRGRKSPGRFSVRSQRFHADGSPERLKSDDCYRSTSRPGRFSELSGGRGRGRKYDANNRMKYHDRYEFPHRQRQYETSPVPRRFSCDAEE